MYLSFALAQLKHNKKRVLTTLVTLTLGACVLYTFLMFVENTLQAYANHMIKANIGHGVVAPKGHLSQPAPKPMGAWISNWEDLLESLMKFDSVKNVYPRVQTRAQLSGGSFGMEPVSLQGFQCGKEQTFFTGVQIVEGRCPDSAQDEVLLGLDLKETRGFKMGNSVTFTAPTAEGSANSFDAVVVGFYSTGNNELDSMTVKADLNSVLHLLASDQVEMISIELKEGKTWNTFSSEFDSLPLNNSLEALPFDDFDPTYYRNTAKWLAMQGKIVAALIYLILSVCVITSFSMLHLQRQSQYGCLLANGDRKSSLFMFICFESAVYSALSVVFALALNLIVSQTFLRNGIEFPPPPGGSMAFQVAPHFSAPALLLTFVTLIGVGLTAALLAAVRVMRRPISQLLMG
jgi:ABC-type lipoprotein release transport system permease subunit